MIDQPRAVLLEAPTEAGKTRMAGTIADRICAVDRVVWFWFAPFAGLVGQAGDVLRGRFPDDVSGTVRWWRRNEPR